MPSVYSHPLNGPTPSPSRERVLLDWLAPKTGNNNQICQALYAANPTINSLPWLTLVIGSELLTPKIKYAPSSTIARAVSLGLFRLGVPEDTARDVGMFVLSLLLSRRGLDFSIASAPDDDDPDSLARFMDPLDAEEVLEFFTIHDNGKPHDRWSEWVLRLVHAAACLNETYFLTKRAYGVPINRWEDEDIIISKLDWSSSYLVSRWKVAEDVVAKAQSTKLPADEEADLPKRNRRMSVVSLLNSVITGLAGANDSCIATDDLLTLTEVAWYYLTVGLLPPEPDCYLSWPEVLLAVGLTRDPDTGGRTTSRPALSGAEQSQKSIRAELEPASRKKAILWQGLPQHSAGTPWKAADDHPVENAYRAYARLLVDQAQVSFDAFSRHVEMTRQQNETSSAKGADTQDTETTDKSHSAGPNWGAIHKNNDSVCQDEIAANAKTLLAESSNTDQQEQEHADLERKVDPTPSSIAGTAPLATAFVTTFDIELEFALRHFYCDTPFAVILPVNVTFDKETSTAHASTVWLGYVVGPFDDPNGMKDDQSTSTSTSESSHAGRGTFEEITRPDADRWFVVRSGTDSGELKETSSTSNPYQVSSELLRELTSTGKLPIVIRLSGSPLVHLPKFNDPDQMTEGSVLSKLRNEIALALDRTNDATPQLFHALVLEESHSMFLSFPEFAQEPRQGLPPMLANYFPVGYWRYWTLLGVQASDNPIRYRLIAQISGVPRDLPTNIDIPRSAGMALNRERSLTQQANDVLRWANFDIIQGDVTAMTEHLDHYCEHLESGSPPNPDLVRVGDRACRLKKGDDDD